ncbi:MAG TPA: hypothetical protein VN969_03175 [Streptosporangiaceae bacterium]|jgi:hypothetical protein|nr:hypothetical protein [Streptosporangiaceae bacterium]
MVATWEAAGNCTLTGSSSCADRQLVERAPVAATTRGDLDTEPDISAFLP